MQRTKKMFSLNELIFGGEVVFRTTKHSSQVRLVEAIAFCPIRGSQNAKLWQCLTLSADRGRHCRHFGEVMPPAVQLIGVECSDPSYNTIGSTRRSLPGPKGERVRKDYIFVIGARYDVI